MTTFRLKHISGLRKEYTLDLDEQELQEAIDITLVTRNKDTYYMFRQFEILNPNTTIVDRCKGHYDLQTHKPKDIDEITVQSTSGAVSKVTHPEYDFEFDGEYLLYKGDRVVEINGFSMTTRENGLNFIRMAQVYGVIPNTIHDKQTFPHFKEPTILFEGYDAYSYYHEPLSLELRGVETENIWSHIVYMDQSNKIKMLLPGTPMIITHINRIPVNPKRVWKTKKLEVVHI